MTDDPKDDQPQTDAPPPGAEALADMAEEYLNLWQSHLQTLSADPSVQKTWTDMMQSASASQTAFAALMGQMGQMGQAPAPDGAGGQDDPAERPETAAPADGGGSYDLAGLVKRLADLERRVAELEGKRSKSTSGPVKAPRKRRSS